MWQSFSDNLGDLLKTSLKKATDSVILVAPFITLGAFEELIDELQPSVNLKVITRWNVGDIVAGVSDPAIWESLQQRDHSEIFLTSNLHAKYFRFDSKIFVGSANITNRALGFSNHSNIELLTVLNDLEAGSLFEQRLLQQAVAVDQDLYESTIQLLVDVRAVHDAPTQDKSLPPISAETWLPLLRHPAELWNVYSGKTDSLTSTTIGDALSDLAMWDIPRNLDQSNFRHHVAINLLHMPLIVGIDKLLIESQRFGAVRDYISGEFLSQGVERKADECWQSTIRWFRFFRPDRYEYSRPNISEVMVRKQS